MEIRVEKKSSNHKLASLGIELRHLYPELRIGRVGVTAVAVFHPFGTSEESAHLTVVATVGKETDEVDQLIRLAVLAVPFYRRKITLGTAAASQTICQQLLYSNTVFDVTLVCQIVDEISQNRNSLVAHDIFQVKILRRHVGAMTPVKIILGQKERCFLNTF